MTLKSHWLQRVQTSAKAKPAFDALEFVMNEAYRLGDAHIYAVFNDRTMYRLCGRYQGEHGSGIASLELKRCAAIVVPTEDPVYVPADCVVYPHACNTCVGVTHVWITSEEYDAIDVDSRIIWRDIRKGEIERADPYGMNLRQMRVTQFGKFGP